MKIVKGKKKIVVDKDRTLKLITEIHHPEVQQACNARRIERTFSDVYFVNGIRYLVEDVLKKCNGTCKKMKSAGVPPSPMPVRSSKVIERVQIDLIEMYGRNSPHSTPLQLINFAW